MRIAVFGGTFDPPHLGHRAAIAGLFKDPGVERVVVLPSGNPPQKVGLTDALTRLELVRLGLGSEPADPFREDLATWAHRVEICDYEVQRSLQVPGTPQYTFDTLLELQSRYGPQIANVIGLDQLANLPTWSRFPDLLRVSNWIVLERKPTSPELIRRAIEPLVTSRLLEPRGDREWKITGHPIGQGGTRILKLVTTEAPEISSTYIRENIARTGAPSPDLLHPRVRAYLNERGLYGSRPGPLR
jgi:nicotinate-nucleotide adenylyltransferase